MLVLDLLAIGIDFPVQSRAVEGDLLSLGTTSFVQRPRYDPGVDVGLGLILLEEDMADVEPLIELVVLQDEKTSACQGDCKKAHN